MIAAAKAKIALPANAANFRRLQVSADRLQLQNAGKGSTLELSGNVKVAAGPMTIRARRVKVTIDRKGRASGAVAAGKVRVTLGKRSARARLATLRFSAASVELDGDAQLVCPSLGVTLAGERIALSLADGQVVVSQARAELVTRAGSAGALR